MKIFLLFLFLIISIPEYAQTVQKAESISAKSDFIKVNTLKFKPVKKLSPIEYFSADKDSIISGERAMLKWAVKNEGNVSIEVSENQQDFTLLSSSASKEGSLIVTPNKTSHYRIITNESTKMFALKVIEKVVPVVTESPNIEAVIESFKASKTSVKIGEKVKLEWVVKNVPRVSLEFGDSVEKAIYYNDYLSDTFEYVTPQKTTVYVLRSGDVIKTIKIEVAPK
jgi:hypothetical protein